MSTLFDTETHLDRHDHPETEFTLSTASLLGIFFGLALVCGVFFGFGYWMGRKSTDARSEVKTTTTANVTDTVADSSLADIHPKPSASQELQSQNLASPNSAAQNSSSQNSSQDSLASGVAAIPAPPLPPPAPAAQLKPAPIQAAAEAPPERAPAKATVLPVASPPQSPAAPKPSAGKSSPAKIGAIEATAAARTPTYGALPAMTGTSNPIEPTVVQIAAVSHQEDADVLVAALKKRGYNVGIRHEPQDQLMHVQVGPFANRADAVAMRQKLLADGYNAIVKP